MTSRLAFSKVSIVKTICIILCLFGTQWSLHAQFSGLKKADKLFAEKSYVEAAKIYQSLKKDKHVLLHLADSYYYNNEMRLARTPYAGLFTNYKDSLDKEVYFRFAQSLKGIKDYEKGDEIMSEYLGYTVDTKQFISNLNRLVPYNYEITRLVQSTRTGDFGISYFGDKVVFSSFRNIKNPIYSWNNQPYLDLYQADVTDKKTLENIEPFSDDINTTSHESNATFTSDGKTMYFSRSGSERLEVNGELIATIKIYRADFIDGHWKHVTELPFSSNTYSVQHPMLNADNTKLYFSSDMPGSFGSFDIYYVNVTENSGYEEVTYSDPIHLDGSINTIHREQFPFVAADNTLYFASDGHQGLGGLDIFMSREYNGIYAKPLNLGESINSEADDFAYVLDQKSNSGFFSSNRAGYDNIYAFERISNKRHFTVEGEVRDKYSQELLPGTKIELFDEFNNLVGQMVVEADAKYIFETEPNKTYIIDAHRDFYVPTTQKFTTNDMGKITFNIELILESYDDAEDMIVTKDDGYIYIELENIYFDLNKWDIKPQAAKTLDVLVALLNKYPRMEIELGAHTDSRSSDMYNLHLSHNRAKATMEYLIENGIDRKRLRARGYGERFPLVDCGDNCSEIEHSINRRCEFIILK